MATEITLKYIVKVADEQEYSITARIGDAQPGDHNAVAKFPLQNNPKANEPEWNCVLGKGKNIKSASASTPNLLVNSTTKNANPNTDFVSCRIFINSELINPEAGPIKATADPDEIFIFKNLITFI